MADAATKLAEELNKIKFSSPKINIINNVDVVKEQSEDAIKAALVRQLYSPVRWSETITQIVSDGITKVIEIGPGKVLQGLNKRIDKSILGASMNTPETIQKVQDLIDS
jgi:[acyl-carrier-protein] S-malonyltransferase